MIKGVNLGNWLLLEKWMSPVPFAGVGPGRKHQVNGGDRVTGTHPAQVSSLDGVRRLEPHAAGRFDPFAVDLRVSGPGSPASEYPCTTNLLYH